MAHKKYSLQEEIEARIASLNRSEQTAIVSIDTQRLKAGAIANNRRWFRDKHIAIHQDERTHVWRLGHAPNDKPQQQQEPPNNEE